MSDINDLKSKLGDPDPQIRLEAAKELADLAENGSDEAAEILYERIKKETDQEILIAILTVILENPCKNEDDQRIRFGRLEQFAYQPRILPILPVLRKLKKVPEKLKNSIVRFAKSVVEIHGASGWDTHFAMEFLAFLMDEHDLFAFVDFWLKKGKTDIYDLLTPLEWTKALQDIFSAIKENPDVYPNFVEIFNWFIKHPYPITPIGEFWQKLPHTHREAIRLYYYNKMEDYLEHYSRHMKDFGRYSERAPYICLPSKHPVLEWLESFDRGAVTSSISSFSALSAVAEKIGFNLKDTIRQIETLEPSPITLKRQKEEIQREEVELIPIDKFLGVYIPEEQLIKLYIQEIKDTARRLDVTIEALKRVVELHEAVHAIIHLGRDTEGRNFNTGAFNMVDYGADPSPLHETLAQLISFHICLSDIELLKCFDRLNEWQPKPYGHWRGFISLPLERLRNIVVGIRQGKIEASFEMFMKLAL